MRRKTSTKLITRQHCGKSIGRFSSSIFRLFMSKLQWHLRWQPTTTNERASERPSLITLIYVNTMRVKTKDIAQLLIAICLQRWRLTCCEVYTLSESFVFLHCTVAVSRRGEKAIRTFLLFLQTINCLILFMNNKSF